MRKSRDGWEAFGAAVLRRLQLFEPPGSADETFWAPLSTDEFACIRARYRARKMDARRDPARETLIVDCYYGLLTGRRWSLAEISARLNLTRERVRQLRDRYLRAAGEILYRMRSEIL